LLVLISVLVAVAFVAVRRRASELPERSDV
jgi:hypothetical protein